MSTAALEMSPMATYMDLKDAACAIGILRRSLAKIGLDSRAALAYRSCDEEQLAVLERRLHARAVEFDTRPAPCEDCHIRHTKAEGCFDGR